MNMLHAFISFLLISTTVSAQSDLVTQQSPFAVGVNAYKQQKWDEARDAFSQAVQNEPENPAFLYNLGLAQFQLNQIGLAVALWRRAQYMDPRFTPASVALDFALTKFPTKEVPHEIQYWESLRTKVLLPVHLTTLLTALAILLLTTGWMGLLYLGRRKASHLAGESLPPPPFAVIGSAVLMVLIAVTTALKGVDYFMPRGTITSQQVSVRTGPAEDSAELFDLYGGMEVLIHQTYGAWVQVTYPGTYTGWIKTTDLLHTAGKQPW